MPRKNNRDEEFDTQTTFADMNIEGFGWYDPTKKNDSRGGRNKQSKTSKQKVSRKEYWQLVRGAFAAIAPYVLIFIASVGVVGILLYLWLT